MDIKEKMERLRPFIETKDYPGIAAVLGPAGAGGIGPVFKLGVVGCF